MQLLKSTPSRFALVKFAPIKLAFFRLAPLKSEPKKKIVKHNAGCWGYCGFTWVCGVTPTFEACNTLRKRGP